VRRESVKPAPATACPELELRVRELERELEREQEKRLEREREWLRFTTTLSALEIPSVPEELTFVPDVPEEDRPVPPAPTQIDEAKAERQHEIARSIRTLLSIEGVRGIDLLEAGELHDGWIGPVVFRLLDERGRLAGSLCAERMRLEGSRSARTLTIVLENGYEMRGGVRTPFRAGEQLDKPPIDSGTRDGGTRRIDIVETDPMAWVGAVAELFGDTLMEPPADDGRWNLLHVRGTLNQLLQLDADAGYWRLKHLGGVSGDELRDVHLEALSSDGKLERRLFADRLRIHEQDRGVLLLLEDGAQVRGEEKVPFLDGRFRIFLPRAAHAEWRAAGLPGLAQPPTSRNAQGSPSSG